MRRAEVFKGALLLGLSQKMASPARTELFQIVAAINDAGVEEGRGFLTCFGGRSSTTPQLLCGLF